MTEKTEPATALSFFFRENYISYYERGDIFVLNEYQITGLNQLKEIVLELHRSASNLDDEIRIIESSSEEDTKEYTDLLIKCRSKFRKEVLKHRFDDLSRKEHIAWKLMEP